MQNVAEKFIATMLQSVWFGLVVPPTGKAAMCKYDTCDTAIYLS
jgi:hypothetical protein